MWKANKEKGSLVVSATTKLESYPVGHPSAYENLGWTMENVEMHAHSESELQQDDKRCIQDLDVSLASATDNYGKSEEFTKPMLRNSTKEVSVTLLSNLGSQLEDCKEEESVKSSSQVSNNESQSKISKRHWQSEPRWGRANDKPLFKAIRTLEKEGTLNLDELLKIDARYMPCFSRGILKLIELTEWKGHPRNLVKRIQTLSQPKDLSAREMKLLRKLLKGIDEDAIDYEELLYNFPGKRIEQIKEVSEEIMSRRSMFDINIPE